MRRFAAGIAVTLLLLAFVAQLALPAYVADQTEHRLEVGGGRANVKLKAFPALRLLSRSGDSIEVEGRNLEFFLQTDPGDPLHDLDGFDRVRVEFIDSEANPVKVKRFELTREEVDGDYQLALSGTSTPADLARTLGEEAGGAIGGFLGELGADALPGGNTTDVPVELTATLRSNGGRADIVESNGSVAGVPAGPLTEFVVSVVLERL